jgi:hypothetical protein
VPASTEKDVAVPNSTDGWAAAWALTATATSSTRVPTDAAPRLARLVPGKYWERFIFDPPIVGTRLNPQATRSAC